MPPEDTVNTSERLGSPSFFQGRDITFYIKIIFIILVSIYTIYCTFDPGRLRLVDGLFVFVHEVGHVIGSFISFPVGMVSGTLIEFIFILGLFFYFVIKKQYYSAAIILFFLGRRIDYTSWYILDAIDMYSEAVSFIPWPGATHDWNWMLTEIGQLHNAKIISMIVRGFGFMTIGIAIIGSLWFAVRRSVTVKWSKTFAGGHRRYPNILDDHQRTILYSQLCLLELSLRILLYKVKS